VLRLLSWNWRRPRRIRRFFQNGRKQRTQDLVHDSRNQCGLLRAYQFSDDLKIKNENQANEFKDYYACLCRCPLCVGGSTSAVAQQSYTSDYNTRRHRNGLPMRNSVSISTGASTTFPPTEMNQSRALGKRRV